MSLKQIVKQHVLDDMIRSCNPDSKWKVLVLDKAALRIINAAVNVNELMDENITLIEPLEKRRQPYASLDAVYMISPNLDSVNRIIEDFAKTPLYHAAHLYFTSKLDDRLFHKLKSSQAFKFIKTLKEVYLDFLVVESSVFSCERPWGLQSFFGSEIPSDQLQKEYQAVAKHIAAFCITLNEFPIIRYSSLTSDRVTSKMAALVYEELDNYAKDVKEFPNKEPDYVGKGRAQLYILDRSFDVTAPLLHEFTYQAMANDLVTLTDNGTKYKYSSGDDKKEYQLDENVDPLWASLRHNHIAECVDIIVGQFNKFINDNRAATGAMKGGNNKAANLKDLKEMLSAIPQFQDLKAKFAVHMTIAQECLAIFNKCKLDDMAAVEQDLATGTTADGGAVKNVEVALSQLLDLDQVSLYDKVRLLMLYVIGKDGVKEDDRRKLFEHAQIPSDMATAISNLSLLGVKLSRPANTKSSFFGGKEKKPVNPLLAQKKAMKKKDDLPYDLSRYIPLVKVLLESVFDGSLQKELFPLVRDPSMPGTYGSDNLGSVAQSSTGSTLQQPSQTQATSLRTTKPSWHKKNASVDNASNISSVNLDDKKKGGRVIVFIVGGCTFSEIRSVYEVAQHQKRELYIGSTHISTPSKFVDDMKELRTFKNIPDVQSSIGDLNLATEVTKSKSSLQSAEKKKSGVSSILKGIKKLGKK